MKYTHKIVSDSFKYLTYIEQKLDELSGDGWEVFQVVRGKPSLHSDLYPVEIYCRRKLPH